MTITELLESFGGWKCATNRLVNDTMVGAYLSHFKGRGMDFRGASEYIPGDEVRDIDWNVTYRMGRPFVRRYREGAGTGGSTGGGRLGLLGLRVAAPHQASVCR